MQHGCRPAHSVLFRSLYTFNEAVTLGIVYCISERKYDKHMVLTLKGN